MALQHVTKGIALCRQLVYAAPLATGLVTLAWIRQASGDQPGALAAIGEAAQFAPGPAVNGLLNPVPAERARLLLAQGDLAGAARWTKEKGLGADDEPRYPSEPEHLLLARVLLAEGLPVRRSRCWTDCTQPRSTRIGSAVLSRPVRCGRWRWLPTARMRTRWPPWPER